MTFFDSSHKKEIEGLNKLWGALADLEKLGKQKGIDDIFQDNGAKVLQQVIISDLSFLPGREGNDAIDKNNVEWEFKSLNTETTASGFSTDHHATHELLQRFNSVPWLFSFYAGIHLQEMYVLSPGGLSKWTEHQRNHLDERIREGKGKSLNNPKIPIKYVKKHGTKIFPFPQSPIDPATLDGK
ncbi:restriction endonuclease [Secundilactobacillus silagei]|uniref:Type-2 restriction enzyme PvuII n=1 Tax=Secundilactobacillus silagei JCM 19001 TaxID=1302250 RepID=A0A1Z5IKA2_9LACO|nr:restriction endonuclease [Secundilactobacillus silagei]TDG69948.1 hypothetical protein C5L25_002068 [Secundilactobacillus silagei JCM 19001]GAX02058.1 type-2 restriction enzyme PvuII [Secundilactobacillus silagei JCM 19001]